MTYISDRQSHTNWLHILPGYTASCLAYWLKTKICVILINSTFLVKCGFLQAFDRMDEGREGVQALSTNTKRRASNECENFIQTINHILQWVCEYSPRCDRNIRQHYYRISFSIWLTKTTDSYVLVLILCEAIHTTTIKTKECARMR